MPCLHWEAGQALHSLFALGGRALHALFTLGGRTSITFLVCIGRKSITCLVYIGRQGKHYMPCLYQVGQAWWATTSCIEYGGQILLIQILLGQQLHALYREKRIETRGGMHSLHEEEGHAYSYSYAWF